MHRTPRGGVVARDSLYAAASAIVLQTCISPFLPPSLSHPRCSPFLLLPFHSLGAFPLFLSTSIGSVSFSLLSPPSRRTHVADSCVGTPAGGTEEAYKRPTELKRGRKRTRVMYKEREIEREIERQGERERDRRVRERQIDE